MMTNERLETDKKSIDDTQGKGMQDNQTENDTP